MNTFINYIKSFFWFSKTIPIFPTIRFVSNHPNNKDFEDHKTKFINNVPDEIKVETSNSFSGQVAFQIGDSTTTKVMIYRNGIRIRDHLIPGQYCRRLANLGVFGNRPTPDENKLS